MRVDKVLCGMGMQIKRQFNDEASAFDLALIPSHVLKMDGK
jgi:hypothetical protein